MFIAAATVGALQRCHRSAAAIARQQTATAICDISLQLQVGSAPVSKNSTTSLSATISHNFKTKVTTLQMGAGLQPSRKRFLCACLWLA